MRIIQKTEKSYDERSMYTITAVDFSNYDIETLNHVCGLLQILKRYGKEGLKAVKCFEEKGIIKKQKIKDTYETINDLLDLIACLNGDGEFYFK